jgi:EAL domain-containing protein (putative c-di-GMP-specific phosphodiesterase class I)/ActR/RegA family two-component response regulator
MNTSIEVAGKQARPSEAGSHVLVVDDDEAVLRGLSRLLAGQGYRVQVASSGSAALAAVGSTSFDAILSDVDMPTMSGIELLRRVRAIDVDVPLVLITGNPTLEAATAAVEQGALRYISKPVDSAALLDVICEATRLRKLAWAKREALELAGGYENVVVGASGVAATFQNALDTLFIAYQPIVSWPDRKVFGYEALLRSREPRLPHPGAVLDAAERLKRTADLGRTIRAKAAPPMVQAPAELSLFVNLHTRDLLDEELYAPDSALAEIASTVVLEITERASLAEVPDVQARLVRLRAMGFRIAVDDLGAGYAGLTSFALLEPEIVKLDMSLVRGMHEHPKKRVLVRTMIAMCKELGMQVVGEGVETVEERDALAEEGCTLMQGYLFAKPGDAFPSVRW